MKDCGFQFKNSYTDLPGEFYTRLDPETVEVLERMVAEREQTKRVIINKAIRAFAQQTRGSPPSA